MSHAVHPGSPFRALYAQAVALRDPLHRRDAAATASLGHATATSLGAARSGAAQPISLEAFRRSSHQRRSTVVRITNALGLFVALYAAVVLMRFAG